MLESLTDREMEILILISLGYANQEIADRLVVSLNTVKKHISNLYSKMGINSRTEALIYALRQGWLHADLFK